MNTFGSFGEKRLITKMENEINEIEMLKEKLDFYTNKKIMIHIELKNKRFLNAHIIKKENDNVYLIDERVIGNLHLFVNDIYSVSEYRSKGVEE
jgi:hypothetical protein